MIRRLPRARLHASRDAGLRGRRWLGKSAVGLGVGLTCALAACSEGCARELPVTEPEFAQQRMDVEQLGELLLPDGNGRWQMLAEYQLFALERVVALLLEQAEAGSLHAGQHRRVDKLARAAGLELHEVELELEQHGQTERLWVLIEPRDDRRGRGTYVMRLGPLTGHATQAGAGEGRGRGARGPELLLQAPHSRHDKYTGTIALLLFAEHGREHRVRGLFLNSVHRYVLADGNRKKQEPPEANEADAAHREDHPLARATARTLARSDLALVQVHGFDRNTASGDPDVIVSAGSRKPHAWARDVADRLRVELPQFSVGLFGVDGDRLGALTNVQGQAARTSGRCFVHVEASERVRESLRDQPDARRRFVAAVFGAEVLESRGGCQ